MEDARARLEEVENRSMVLSPDPTALTNTLVAAAKDELRREIDFRLQILVQRFEALDKATLLLQDWRETLPRRLEEALKGYEKVIDQRFQTIQGLFGTLEERFKSFEIQFRNVQTQFHERDTRSDMMAQSGEKNIASALAAAKELVSAQNIASANAIDKSGRDVDKRIDTTVQLLQTSTKALDERLGTLAEQAKTSMTRQEVESLFRTLSDKLDGPTGLAMRLEGVIARGNGTTVEQGRQAQQNQWIIGAILGGLAFLVALVTLAMKVTSQ